MDDRALEHDETAWSVERDYVNDADYVVDARSFTASALSTHLSARPDWDELLDRAKRVVTELFENATHTKAPLIRVNVAVDREVLRIDVEDHRRGMPTCTPVEFATPTSDSVQVVDRLASRWDCEPTTDGMHVWAEIALA